MGKVPMEYGTPENTTPNGRGRNPTTPPTTRYAGTTNGSTRVESDGATDKSATGERISKVNASDYTFAFVDNTIRGG